MASLDGRQHTDASRLEGRFMRVAYITMLFPAPSETFHSNDVRQVAASGAGVTVHALRRGHPAAARMLAERGLSGVGVSHNAGPRTLRRALAAAVRRPHVALGLLEAILKTCAGRPVHLAKSLWFFPRVLEIFEELLTDRPEVVHTLWGHYPAMVLHLVERHLPDVVISISFSVYDITYRYPISLMVAQRADVVRSLSRVTAEEAAEAYGIPLGSIHVIPDSVDLSLLSPRLSKTPARIVTAARLVRDKGIDLVLRSFARVLVAHPDASLHVLGDGPELRNLRALTAELRVSHAVEFLGHVAQAAVMEEMLQAEVFLFLSLSERLPNVVKEAMASGCVCVVSRTIGIDELVVDGLTGYIVDQGAVEAASEHVINVLNDRGARDHMIHAAAEHIHGEYSLRTNTDRYLALWRESQRRRGLRAPA